MKLGDRVSSVGGIYDVSLPDRPRYLGSCASLGLPTHFVTAAHCVRGRPIEDLAVNHYGHTKQPFSPVRHCWLFEPSDLAVLETVVEDPKWIQPFIAVRGAAGWGEAVTAIGQPVAVLTEHQQESLRFFRGFVQRPFIHTGRLGHQYAAYELSFPSPPGLSGGPLFADDEPLYLLGVITENFASYTLVDSFEEVEDDGHVKRTESRSVVTYGVATNPFGALAFLEEVIPVGNLNAAERGQRPA